MNQKSNIGNKKVNRRKYRLRRRMYALTPEAHYADPAVDGSESTLEPASAAPKGPLALQLQDVNERLVRARADMENQRKRFQKEKEDIRKFACEDIIRELINPMEHFALAMHSLETAQDVSSVRQGVTMIHRELITVLEQAGLKEISPIGQHFDPNEHEAVGTEHSDDHEEGAVTKVMRPGWKLKERVIRPAMVQVNRKASSTS